MEKPTGEQVRARSELLTEKYSADDNPSLLAHIDDAVSLVQALTCRRLTAEAGACASSLGECEDTPEALIPTALRAVTLVVEQFAIGAESKFARSRARGQRLRGFTAGRYSEQYFEPGGRGSAKDRPRMADDPELDAALWALCTEACRAAFVAEVSGVQEPASATTQVSWGSLPGGY